MSKINDAEVRRLLSYLQQFVSDEGLATVEDELRGEFAGEYLREPEILNYFPELSEDFVAENIQWKLRVISHAHLRMVQRGIKLVDILDLFHRFVRTFVANEQVIFIGHFAIVGRIKQRNVVVTLRVDVDTITDTQGSSRLVTLYTGRGDIEDTVEVNLT